MVEGGPKRGDAPKEFGDDLGTFGKRTETAPEKKKPIDPSAAAEVVIPESDGPSAFFADISFDPDED